MIFWSGLIMLWIMYKLCVMLELPNKEGRMQYINFKGLMLDIKGTRCVCVCIYRLDDIMLGVRKDTYCVHLDPDEITTS